MIPVPELGHNPLPPRLRGCVCLLRCTIMEAEATTRRSRSRGARASWSVRFGLAAVLSVALSGAPGAALAAAGKSERCPQQCDAAGDYGCPPRVVPCERGLPECEGSPPDARRHRDGRDRTCDQNGEQPLYPTKHAARLVYSRQGLPAAPDVTAAGRGAPQSRKSPWPSSTAQVGNRLTVDTHAPALVAPWAVSFRGKHGGLP